MDIRSPYEFPDTMPCPTKSPYVCLIPARGASSRIPDKNLKPFCGRPLVWWTMHAARQSGLPAYVLTDSPAIARLARQMDLSVVDEPPEVACGQMNDREQLDVVLESLGYAPTIVYLQPTVPLRPLSLVHDVVALHRRKQHDVIYSVSEQRAWLVDAEGHLVWPRGIAGKANDELTTQAIPPHYVLNGGAILISQRIVRQITLLPLAADLGMVVIDANRAVDLDWPDQWRVAEHLGRFYLPQELLLEEVTR